MIVVIVDTSVSKILVQLANFAWKVILFSMCACVRVCSKYFYFENAGTSVTLKTHTLLK